MQDEATTTMIANDRASERLAKASAALTRSATEIAEEYGIPEGINGLSAGEFLGRTSFVISMQRDLRRAGVDLLAQKLLRNQLNVTDPIPQAADVDNVEAPKAKTGGEPGPTPPADSLDVSQIPGLTVQMVKALKGAGIHQLAEVEKFTDEALLKCNGIAGPSLAKIRACVAEVRLGK